LFGVDFKLKQPSTNSKENWCSALEQEEKLKIEDQAVNILKTRQIIRGN